MSRNKYPEETVNLIIDVSLKLFLEKGYENTSIQDIINGLGGLSKGAIYHHFKSKEAILAAVSDKCNESIIAELREVRDDKNLNGYQKLKKMFRVSLSSSSQDIIFTLAPSMMENPRLLVLQLQEIFTDIAPIFIQPVIEQGINDGSIQTDFPKELSEVMILLTNIWLNPLVIEANPEEMTNRARCFNSLLKGMGLDLLDDELIARYTHYCQLCHSNQN